MRSWNWQRLSIKVQEDLTSEDVDSLRLFGKFEEIGVVKNTERSNHMDMGEGLAKSLYYYISFI